MSWPTAGVRVQEVVTWPAMPHATVTTMPGQAHGAQTADPALVARLIADQARTVGLGEPAV